MVTWRSGRRAGVALGCGAALVLCACKARNPAFGEGGTEASDDEGRTSPSDTSGDGTTRGDSKGTASDSEGNSDALTSTTTSGATTHSNSDTEVDPQTSSDSSGPARTCEPYTGPLVHGVMANSAPVPCPGALIYPEALLLERGEVIGAVGCEDCPGNCGGAEVAIDLDSSVTVPLGLPDCVRISLWGAPEQAKTCDWRGMTIFDLDDNPLFVVSDDLSAPAAAGGMQAVPTEPMPCDGMCSAPPHPGSYSLSMGAEPVPSGGDGMAVIEVDGDLLDGQFHNRSTVVGADCEIETSWILDFAEG